MGTTLTRRQTLQAGGIVVVGGNLFHEAARFRAAATTRSGGLTVDVAHENGNRATEVNALVVWQDEVGGSPYKLIENYPSVDLPYTFSNPPPGHEYLVNAYILDQLAGNTGWVSINSDESKRRTISASNPVWLRPRVFDATGEDPLANAIVEVRTHEDDPNYVWRRATTTSDGYVNTPDGKLWLFPSSEGGGYYMINVIYNSEEILSKKIDVLNDNRELQLYTSVSATPTRTPTPTTTATRTRTRTPTSTPTQTGAPASGQGSGQDRMEILLAALGLLGLGGLGGGGAWWMIRRGNGDDDRGPSASGETEASSTDPSERVRSPSQSGTPAGDDTLTSTGSNRSGLSSNPGIPAQIPRAPDVHVEYDALTNRQLIGSGGNAEVVRATLPTPDGQITLAIKEPHLSGTLHSDQITRLLEEAETWDKLDDHDHIVGVIDYGSEPVPWIAMEYMDGGHLGDRVGKLDLEQALWTAVAVTKGVRHAHRRGVAHLDLKPENVLFRTVGDAWDVPKVADWGFSRHLIEHSRSVEGMTVEYAAPEQFDEGYGLADDITDVYQLGAVFYELFTGRPPFEGETLKLIDKVKNDRPVPPSELVAVPAELDEILLTALSKQKSERYDDIVYLRDDLQELYDEH